MSRPAWHELSSAGVEPATLQHLNLLQPLPQGKDGTISFPDHRGHACSNPYFPRFVSSTFEDLKEERDAFQREVFPKLRTLCASGTVRGFMPIDLRWGVRDEAALDQKTMEICLREIERCQRTGIKPNFMVLLGQRYGWRPLPSRVEAREFEAVLESISELRGSERSWSTGTARR